MIDTITPKKINNKILQIKEEIEKINQLDNIKQKAILTLCILDSYSQLNVFSNSGSNENAKKFEQFIEEFYPTNYWNDIGFVNLAYTIGYNGFKDKIEAILGSSNMCISNYHGNAKVTELINEMKENLINNSNFKVKVGDTLNKYISKYTYKSLFYKYRSKLIHDYTFPGLFDDMLDISFPCYISVIDDRRKEENNDTIFRDEYDLVFPYEFIKSVAIISIENYLNKCLVNNIYPYSKYKEKFSWYE